MPRLANGRHELFCACLANGWSFGAAYKEAGYKPDDSAAARLARKVQTQTRVAEMRATVAVSSLISVEIVTRELLDIARSALSIRGLSHVAGLNCARGCWETIAKINGLMADKATFTLNLRAEDMTDAQLLAIAARGLKDDIEAESDQSQSH